MEYSILYWWKIVARDSQGEETIGPEWSFTTTANQQPVPGSGLWSDATDFGDGWKHLEWFGVFWVDEASSWIYHSEHGWAYAYGDETSSIWFYTPDMGWFWTSDSYYPMCEMLVRYEWN